MKVVMLGPFGLGPKGTMRARALPAARALAARGHDVALIMPPWHTPRQAGRAWRDESSDVRLTYVSLAGLRAPGLGHGLVAWRMAREVAAARPDVVHAFKPKAYSGLAATLVRARQRFGGRHALVMDTDDWEGPGGWNTIEPYSRPQRRFFAWQERFGLRHADAVTVASRALETLAWSLGVTRERVHYVPNAVGEAGEIEPVDGAAARPPNGARLLLYTRFFEFDLARPLDVLSRVRDRRPDVTLVVAGAGLFGEQDRFLALARERGLADAIDYRGWLEADAAAALFAEADLALYPFDDTLVNRTKSPVKLLDLMAAGLPVVGEAVGELREVIEPGVSGLLVPPGETDAFATAVVRLLADDGARQRMGRAARARVLAAYTWDRRVAALETVYAAAARSRT